MVTLGVYGKLAFEREQKRWQMWERKENLANLPAHHFSNRGGTVFEKQFIGFEKYHTSQKSIIDWYKNAYPTQFATSHAE